MITISKETFFEEFRTIFEANDKTLLPLCTDAVIEKFYLLTDHMLTVNATMNLTAITDPKEIIVKHYADCALAVSMIPMHSVLADVGTGGGYPSLPLAILRPDLTITAIDSTQKKLDYVASAAEILGLSNLTVHAARAEELGKQPEFREQFDFVCARAVARMRILSEWCLPLVKKGGLFLAMKARSGQEELEEAAHAIDVLGGITQEVRTCTLLSPCAPDAAKEDSDAMTRNLILVKKRQFTPKQYPRANAQISKKPL